MRNMIAGCLVGSMFCALCISAPYAALVLAHFVFFFASYATGFQGSRG